MLSTTGAIIRTLQEQAESQGSLPVVLDFYRKLLELQSETEAKITIPVTGMSAETARGRRLAGRPLAAFGDIPFQQEEVAHLYQRVLKLFELYPGLFKPLRAEIRDLAPGQVINEKTLREWFRGKPVTLPVATTLEDQTLIEAVFNITFKPFLTLQATSLQKHLVPEEWRRGFCPVCGGNPDFALLSKDNGSRHLVCCRCDTEWLYQRLQCPYCNNAEPRTLSYFTDEQSCYRLYVCEPCRRYLKAIDLRLAPEDVHPPLERLLTLDLDRQARAKGYH